ncbi:MAG TPA: translocation/assembly module TamB domain-containing protein [Casimicrobiaceae bacterium]|nr:translocation/assembly module TamB domain-containing protein [Casimicrobiaceae bacterium]
MAIVAIGAFAVSEHGLAYIAARIGDQSGGQLRIESPSGSIANTMRFGRITLHAGDDLLVLDDVVVDWDPWALLHKQVAVRRLSARRLELTTSPSETTLPLPTDLAPTFAIDIARIAVDQLDWQRGAQTLDATGLSLAYAADSTSNRVHDLALSSDVGTLRADVDAASHAPFAVTGKASVTGAGTIDGVHADITIDGPLARMNVSATGAYRDMPASFQAIATLFSTTRYASANAEISNVDLASFDPSLPHTRGRMHVAFAPRGDGIVGTLDIVNDAPAPIDAEGLPLSTLTSRFSLAGRSLALDDIDASLAGGGARGNARIDFGDQRTVHAGLTISDVDLARVQSNLATTRLSGRINADADTKRQTIEADVRERDLALAFAAAIEDRVVDVSRFRAAAAGGSLAGVARFTLNDANDFSVRATMARLDPSRFAKLPKASLDGTIVASGALHPQWRASAEVNLAPSSRLAAMPFTGHAKGRIARMSIGDLTADVRLGSTHLRATGAAGTPGDRLSFVLDAPKLAELTSVAPSAWTTSIDQASPAQPLAGALHAEGRVSIARQSVAGDVTWRARSLRFGEYAATSLDAHVSLAGATSNAATLENRALSLDVEGTHLALGARSVESLRASVKGSAAHHHMTLAIHAGDIDAQLALDGSLRNVERIDDLRWSGTLASLVNRGSVPVSLEGPAAFALWRGYVRFEHARIDVADGRADIGEFTWDGGRVTTRGSFAGIPVAKAARLAGRSLPVDSTLVVGGDWSIAASPRLNGRFTLARERGDVRVDVPSSGSNNGQAIGISELKIAGTFKDDALDAQASFASARAGTLQGTLAIGTIAGARFGSIDPSAPLRLAVRGELASLGVFQPWIGTDAAIGGRAIVDVSANGTVGRPLWNGTVSGDALSFDAPRYGVHLGDGQLRAHLTQAGVALDRFHITGGDGSFDASGLVGLPGESTSEASHVTWKATKFRIANRPDLRFVLDGDGSVALENRRLALRGKIAIDDGHVEYEPSPSGKLASDIVIVGEKPAEREESGNVPLALDVDIDIGRNLTFQGEGLDVRLAGRVHITTDANGRVRADGTIRAVYGTYMAFGQRLTIDHGRLIFDGPADNPALDVVALRKNLPVEAGVAITGTVKVPIVKVTSNPPVSENEALAWLVTGQGLNSGGRIDYGALGAASAALLARNGKPFTADVAQRLGLDEISLQSSATSASGAQGTASQVVVFGKRISDKLSLGYEQGLSLATSAVRLEYALSGQVTLRAEAGTTSGISIVYRRNFR